MDLNQLANYRAYIKLMIDGTPSKAFSEVQSYACVQILKATYR
jgi:hypothetical protein